MSLIVRTMATVAQRSGRKCEGGRGRDGCLRDKSCLERQMVISSVNIYFMRAFREPGMVCSALRCVRVELALVDCHRGDSRFSGVRVKAALRIIVKPVRRGECARRFYFAKMKAVIQRIYNFYIVIRILLS